MRDVTLCFLNDSNNRRILLGMKKRGFGEGKLNGYGGKVHENETIEEAVVRELHEEAKVEATVSDIRKVGEIDFHFPSVENNAWDQKMHIFMIDSWNGNPEETDEMKPFWTNVDEIPFESMWKDDKYWLPIVMESKHVKGMFAFGDDNESIIDMNLEEHNSLFN